jgi:16S rRNA processing protein RimM
MAARSSAGGRVCVGRIGAAHGTRGEVKLWSFTADPMAIRDYGVLATEDGTRTFTIETLRPGKDFLVARLAGVADRTAAEKLCNLDLYIARERLPQSADADEFYHADLIGLMAVGTDGRELGNVVAIHNFGASDLIEVRPVQGGMTVMLPFTEAIVPVVDVAGGRIVVVPPEGTFADGIATGKD